jgi:hypothetical protein
LKLQFTQKLRQLGDIHRNPPRLSLQSSFAADQRRSSSSKSIVAGCGGRLYISSCVGLGYLPACLFDLRKTRRQL